MLVEFHFIFILIFLLTVSSGLLHITWVKVIY